MPRILRVLLLLFVISHSIFAIKPKPKKKKRVQRTLAQVVTSYNRQKTFPLKVSKSGRFLVSQYGEAFLVNADAGWNLFHKIRLEAARTYIASRQAKFFNTIFLQLLPPEPSDRNAYGEAPFHREGDFAMPNEVYFNYVDEILKSALARQMLVGINPAWLGCCRNGWYDVQYNVGPENCRAYGQFLAARFKKYPNLFWIMGGDRDPLRETVAQRAIAEGIKAESPEQLLTFHAASSHSSTDVFPNENWLDFSMVYTYFRGKENVWTTEMPQVYESARSEWQKIPAKPFILGESQYEDENIGSALMVRRQAYWTILSGGAGHCYGSSVWDFKEDWQQRLNLEGAVDMAHFHKIMLGLPWEYLRPELSDNLIVEGQSIYGSEDYISVGVLPNHRMTLMYLPSGRPLKIDMEKLKGSNLRAVWINPRNNKRWIGGYFKPKGIKELTPPTLREDWLLLIGNIGKK